MREAMDESVRATTHKLHFSINGEFLTSMARERYYQSHDMAHAVDLLRSATVTDQLSPEEQIGIVMMILDGKYDLKGTYPGNDYGLVENKDYAPLGVFDTMKPLAERIETLENELREEREKFCYIAQAMGEYELRDANQKYYEESGKPLFGEVTRSMRAIADAGDQRGFDPGSAMVESFIQRQMMNRDRETDDDYGWLSPDGTFYPVEWAQHGEWATEYLDEHYPRQEHPDVYGFEDGGYHPSRDVLIYKLGWILLHNPYQGMAMVTMDEKRRMTKAQRETLYDYYIERGMTEKANALFGEDR